MEIWKDAACSGQWAKYEVSNFGRVRSLDRKSIIGDNVVKGRVLKQTILKTGYCCIGVGRISRKVHRLVATAFIPNPENKPHINHKNGIKTDNHVDNLEWCTPKENVAHSVENGLQPSKLQKKETLFIRDNYEFMGSAKLSKMFGVTKSYVVGVALGKSRKHFGGVRQTKSNWVGDLPIPIIEYDLNMKELRRYTSASQASKVNKFLIPRIKEVLLGEKPTYKGRIYRYEDPELAAKYQRQPKKPTVTQYDLNGDFVASYFGTVDAANKTGISKYLIRDVLAGVQKKTHGFVFKWAEPIVK